ncbi:SPOR domain-containing protein [Croceicoccus bisphenolivorans]|uniref:SPOR domain-containing protein n=1 Tax=Croceicoccus bisphenolivorans TaxID=1783232 RepID=UPI0008374FBB|nr:SPOR domain-containing protein [Croceicoccus bisphenolivorans]
MSKSFRFETLNRTALRAVIAGTMLAGVAVAQPALAGSVDKASEALSENETDRAVLYAEKAVEEAPRDASRRALLGQAYLRAGRLVSARAALNEAITLGETNPRVALMLALAEIGSGSPRNGVTILAQQGNSIPAADRGLAFALAGETARGVEIISADIRAGNDNSKTRQNLAYAFALDGRWREARLMAAQDVPADMLDRRMTEWAMNSRADQVGNRVAALVGATLQADSGMPVALALANFPTPAAKAAAPMMAEAKPVAPAPVKAAAKPAPAPVVVAKADPAPVVVAKAAEPVVVARAEPAKSEVKTAAVPASKPATMQMAVIQPTQENPAAKPAAMKVAMTTAKPAPVKAKVAAPALPAPSASGTHVAQLGSYTSEANARAGWKVFQSRYANLKGAQPVITQAKVDGKDYWRVAAGSFDAKGANAMCAAVKASGNGCLPIAQSSAKADSKVRVAKAD